MCIHILINEASILMHKSENFAPLEFCISGEGYNPLIVKAFGRCDRKAVII